MSDAKPENTEIPEISPKGIREYMAASSSETDWNARCDAIKRANGGYYPTFWYPTIVLSGLANKCFSSWREQS